MKLTSHEILKFVVKNREVSLADIEPLIEKVFNDYRDYYPLAMLCTDEYIKCDWSINGAPVKDEKVLASMFYSAISKERKVNMYTAPMNPVAPENNKFHTTPKAELYFSSEREKRSDRIFSMAIGIIVGICTAVLTVKLNLK